MDADPGARPAGDLGELLRRRALTEDAARPEAVARRHAAGGRTARENVADLVDPGSFVEYGRFALAAQRARRTEEELIARTPADGLVGGTATVDGAPVAVLAYDATVMAGTQGIVGHRKKDRLFDVIRRLRLPTVFFTEGGGLGRVDADAVGPAAVQAANGVIDVLAGDEAGGTRAARALLACFRGPGPAGQAPDQAPLRDAVPERHRRAFPVLPVVETLADAGSVTVLRERFAPELLTALGRIEGRPVGFLANDSRHAAGAITAAAGDKGARFLQLCDAFGLPVVSLVDTPGMMVGPEHEATGLVRHCSRLLVAGAALRVPLVGVILRRGFGLGAQAMLGGSTHQPVLTVAWPSARLGPMGLEGAVRLALRRELEAIDDEAEREARVRELTAAAEEHARAVNAAALVEIDDVIDPAETRGVIAATLRAAGGTPWSGRFVDTW